MRGQSKYLGQTTQTTKPKMTVATFNASVSFIYIIPLIFPKTQRESDDYSQHREENSEVPRSFYSVLAVI